MKIFKSLTLSSYLRRNHRTVSFATCLTMHSCGHFTEQKLNRVKIVRKPDFTSIFELEKDIGSFSIRRDNSVTKN